MPQNLKLFINKTVIEVSFRTEEGLPLVAGPYMATILNGILARAQSLYPVTICHFIVMANHLHMILVVRNPADVKDFVGYVKRESAHAINRLLGRRQRTIWCSGYDSPIALDAQKVIKRIVYLYTNPQKANLVKRIEDYPNLSSWNDFVLGGREQNYKRVSRDSIPVLPRRQLSLGEQENLANELIEQSVGESVLYIEPDAWIDCFEDYKNIEREEMHAEVLKEVRTTERYLDSLRRNRPVIGAHALRLANIRNYYKAKKHGKRMICLSTDKWARISYISWFREMCEEARRSYRKWRNGDWLAKRPPGLFAPGGFLTANVLRSAAPLNFG